MKRLLLLLLLGGATMFSDVPRDLNAYDAIRDLRDEGWIAGVGGNEFKPFDAVTRAQMAVFIGKAALAPTPSAARCTGMFADVPCDYWAASWIELMVREGYMDGYADGKFYPRNPATRADVVVLIWLLK